MLPKDRVKASQQILGLCDVSLAKGHHLPCFLVECVEVLHVGVIEMLLRMLQLHLQICQLQVVACHQQIQIA